MKKATLQKSVITNFKKIKSLDVDFSERTSIVGANATGKTTIQDAFNWCLFGTNSVGVSVFKVQPLDENNEPIHKITTEVSVTFIINDDDKSSTVTFKRELSEEWVKPRGTAQEILKGTPTTYYVNDVPCKASEFKAKLDDICPEADFKLITSITAFNALSTQDKRRKLQQMAGEVKDLDVAQEFPSVLEALADGKTVEELKREVAAKKSKSKSELEQIPARIDQQEKLRATDLDFVALRQSATQVGKEIAAIDAKLQNSSEASEAEFDLINEKQEQYNGLRQQIVEIEASLSKELREKRATLESLRDNAQDGISKNDRKIRSLTDELHSLEREREKMQSVIENAKKEWIKVNEEQFSDHAQTECPYCHTAYTAEKLTQEQSVAVREFNEYKLTKLKEAEDQAKSAMAGLAAHDECISETKRAIGSTHAANDTFRTNEKDAALILSKLPALDQIKGANKEYLALNEKSEALLLAIRSRSSANDPQADELQQAKTQLQQQLKEIEADLTKEALGDQIDKLKEDLMKEEKILAQAIANMEMIEYQIQQFGKRKIEMVESAVSSLFDIVKWKMYEPNITNDGEKEICECIVDGVPYNGNLNTAARINAGIDICNALAKSIGVCAPIFIDNKESVTNLIYTPSQLITLEVVADQKLTIKNN